MQTFQGVIAERHSHIIFSTNEWDFFFFFCFVENEWLNFHKILSLARKRACVKSKAMVCSIIMKIPHSAGYN